MSISTLPASSTDNLDSRYSLNTHCNTFPKFHYLWDVRKASERDPLSPGFFELVRIADGIPSQIKNHLEISQAASKSQADFRRLGITNRDLEAGYSLFGKLCSDRQKECVEKWNADLAKFTGHKEKETAFSEWKETYAEAYRHGEGVNPYWVEKSKTKLKKTENELHKWYNDEEIQKFIAATEKRMDFVRNNTPNLVECLSQVLDEEKRIAFDNFMRSVKFIWPVIEDAPESAPSGMGRNSEIGVARCSDVVIIIQRPEGQPNLYSLITPNGNPGSFKFVGGRCKNQFTIDETGNLATKMTSPKETAVEEFLEESGAYLEKSHMSDSDKALANELVPDWKPRLEGFDCSVEENESDHLTVVVWNPSATEKIKNFLQENLKLLESDIPVPDQRRTKNSGYSTSLYSATIDSQHPLLPLFLVLPGGSDANSFEFKTEGEAKMERTHQGLFKILKEKTTSDEQSATIRDN